MIFSKKKEKTCISAILCKRQDKRQKNILPDAKDTAISA